jgi:hypothetical protein
MVCGLRVTLVEVDCEGSDFILCSLGVQFLRLSAKGNVIDIDGTELGMLKAELAWTAVWIGVPVERQVKKVTVIGDGTSVTHVPGGGVD